jgi:hypothetical protein
MTHTLGQFAARLLAFDADLKLTEEVVIERACKMVEKEAKRVIGTYDYGWTPLAESTKADRVAHGFPEDEPLLRTGELRDSIGHVSGREGGVATGYVGTNDPVAKYQELGTSRIPSRSFLGEAAMHKEAAIHRMAGRAVIGTFHAGELYHALHLAKESIEKLVDEIHEDEDEKK